MGTQMAAYGIVILGIIVSLLVLIQEDRRMPVVV
jgi:hypothetical protein